MKLKTKVVLFFTVAFAVNIVVLYFGLVGILDIVSGKLMRKQAEEIIVLIQHEIMDSVLPSGLPDHATNTIVFERVKHVSDEGRYFGAPSIGNRY